VLVIRRRLTNPPPSTVLVGHAQAQVAPLPGDKGGLIAAPTAENAEKVFIVESPQRKKGCIVWRAEIHRQRDPRRLSDTNTKHFSNRQGATDSVTASLHFRCVQPLHFADQIVPVA
jgi:hypothetical protein